MTCNLTIGGNLADKSLDTTQHHSPTFDFDERAMLIGASIYVKLVRKLLSSDQGSQQRVKLHARM